MADCSGAISCVKRPRARCDSRLGMNFPIGETLAAIHPVMIFSFMSLVALPCAEVEPERFMQPRSWLLAARAFT